MPDQAQAPAPAWLRVLSLGDTDAAAQVAYLHYLSRHGITTRALREAGASRASLERWRQESAPDGFLKWEAWTRDMAADELESVAHERAVSGVTEPVFGNDGRGRTVIVGHRQAYSDALLLALLRARRPGAFKDRLGVPVRDLAAKREAFAAAVARIRGSAGREPGAPSVAREPASATPDAGPGAPEPSPAGPSRPQD